MGAFKRKMISEMEDIMSFITEDMFMENYDRIRMIFSDPEMYFDPKEMRLAERDEPVVNLLNKIYKFNKVENKWADPKNLSDKLKLFLQFKGEDI